MAAKLHAILGDMLAGSDQIGQGLRERYEVPQELPPKLLALVRRLDAVERNYLPPCHLLNPE